MIRLYTRVSTEEQGDSGLGLLAQERALVARFVDPFPLASLDDIAAEQISSVELYQDVASASDLDREDLNRLMAEIQTGDTLAVAKLDRLTRSIMDFGELLERAAEGGWFIVALDLGVDTSTPTGELLANIMVSVSQWERKMIGLRTREALAERKSNGQTLGRQTSVNREVELQIVALAAKMGPTMIAKRLNELGVPTARGGQCWYPSTVRAILERLEDERCPG